MAVATRKVRLDTTRSLVAGAPAYDPDLTAEPDYFDTVYGYYGYIPYWAPGYVYPGYPYY